MSARETMHLAPFSPRSNQNLREIQLHDLTTHLDIFEDHRENDYEEMLHRFQDIRVEFTEQHEVYRMLRSMTQGTPAEVYFLSILQHLLLIRDDYWARSVLDMPAGRLCQDRAQCTWVHVT